MSRENFEIIGLFFGFRNFRSNNNLRNVTMAVFGEWLMLNREFLIDSGKP